MDWFNQMTKAAPKKAEKLTKKKTTTLDDSLAKVHEEMKNKYMTRRG